MIEPIDCIVYAEDPARDRAEFESWLAGELGEPLDVQRSHDRDAARATEFPDGFLYFRHRIEVEAEHRPLVARLLRLLWDNGIPAVAACDYEDELPERGGYKSRAIPWPR